MAKRKTYNLVDTENTLLLQSKSGLFVRWFHSLDDKKPDNFIM